MSKKTQFFIVYPTICSRYTTICSRYNVIFCYCAFCTLCKLYIVIVQIVQYCEIFHTGVKKNRDPRNEDLLHHDVMFRCTGKQNEDRRKRLSSFRLVRLRHPVHFDRICPSLKLLYSAEGSAEFLRRVDRNCGLKVYPQFGKPSLRLPEFSVRGAPYGIIAIWYILVYVLRREGNVPLKSVAFAEKIRYHNMSCHTSLTALAVKVGRG